MLREIISKKLPRTFKLCVKICLKGVLKKTTDSNLQFFPADQFNPVLTLVYFPRLKVHTGHYALNTCTTVILVLFSGFHSALQGMLDSTSQNKRDAYQTLLGVSATS